MHPNLVRMPATWVTHTGWAPVAGVVVQPVLDLGAGTARPGRLEARSGGHRVYAVKLASISGPAAETVATSNFA